MKIARWVQPGPYDDVTADRGWLSPRAEASALTAPDAPRSGSRSGRRFQVRQPRGTRKPPDSVAWVSTNSGQAQPARADGGERW